ncbi:MAG: 50S ribosomal protein L11 methyltransferase [Clostridiaceae bacterium]|nr:50S ribosomal protein L11 methyltransferase [Clostridiaceae bacterium]
MQANQQWIIFTFSTNHEAAYAIEQFLQMQGAEGVTVEDKIDFIKTYEEQKTPDVIIGDYLDTLSFDVNIEAYFLYQNNKLQINKNPFSLEEKQEKKWINVSDFEAMINKALINIAEISPVGAGYISNRILENEDWQNNWKKYYRTQKFGRIVVNPSWIQYQAKENEILLDLDPGSAFGTGSHETTALVLNFLSDYSFPDLSQKNILDLGTGSGILAIAAAKIFPNSKIDAIDIDEHAIQVAKENAQKNQTNIKFKTAELKDLENEYDLILANLIATLHLDLIPLYKEKLKPGGMLIASGIINLKEEAVRKSFFKNDLKIISEAKQNDWNAFVCKYL